MITLINISKYPFIYNVINTLIIYIHCLRTPEVKGVQFSPWHENFHGKRCLVSSSSEKGIRCTPVMVDLNRIPAASYK